MDLNFQDALLNIITDSNETLLISSRNKECHNCKLIDLGQIQSTRNLSIRIDTYYPSYNLYILDRASKFHQECFKDPFKFGENGTYLLEIKSSYNSTHQCNIKALIEPNKAYLPLIITASGLLLIGLIYAITKFIYKKYYPRISSSYANSRIVNTDFGVVSETSSSYLLNEQDSLSKRQRSKSTRIKSVDVLRGLCLSIMIFVNYGAGGYSFLDHAVWNGINLADTVFPLFIFLMGVSIPLSMKSLLKKSVNQHGQLDVKVKSILYKIFKRTILLFFFGLVTSNSSQIYLSEVRVMGVLQRFSISYLTCALIELLYLHINNYTYNTANGLDEEELRWNNSKYLLVKSKFKEIFMYPIQWLIVIFLMVFWTLLTFLLPIEGCPTGYLGPGGLHDNGAYFNCTGGAAGYIDRIILGKGHVYQEPTSKLVYKSQIGFDPEGLLGCLTSCVMTYFGVVTGHVIIHYQETLKRLGRFVFYAIVYGVIGLVLCKFSVNDGWIPINKNLWSLSFVFMLASIGLLALICLYLLIDIFDVYSGTPFLYLGRNSITIYICHIVFGNYFPNFKVENKHAFLLGNNVYWVAVWCVVAALMNYKRVYINL